MKYNLMLVALLFAGMAQAQAVFDLQSNNSQIENFNQQNQKIGQGKVIRQNNTYTISGSLSDLSQQEINYNCKFSIKNLENALELDLEFYLNPVVYAKNLESKFDGQAVILPQDLKEKMSLPDGEGTFTFYVNNKPFFTEKVRLTDRKVIKSEILAFRGISYKTYVISSNYLSDKTNKVGTTKSTEQITEWFIPEIGIVKSERKNTERTIIFNLK